jgi:hypothetical protein
MKNDTMKRALEKSGYKLRKKRVKWPSVRGPRAVRIDCGTGNAVQFVR